MSDVFFESTKHLPMINLPASKSIGARYLVASYFAGTLKECLRFDDCDDLRVIQGALDTLYSNREGTETRLDIHASGTAFRFMAAVAASTPGADVILTGTPRVCARPMTPLLDVLRAAGARIEPLGEGDTGPFMIHGGLLQGGEYEIRGDVSSQFISAIMLSAPTWKGGVTLKFATPLVSRPYAGMTADVMRKFGIDVTLSDDKVTVKAGRYTAPRDFTVESDWSAAGFFYEAAAIRRSLSVVIAGLESPEKSLQGDSATARFFEKLGVCSTFSSKGVALSCRRDVPGHVEADLSDNPDLVPAFAVACVESGCRFRFIGVRNLRLKESDRLEAIRMEMSRLGIIVRVGEDFLEWQGEMREEAATPVISTYDDHRIAMAFAMVALSRGEIRIANPDVVEKSYADFWHQLPKLGLECRREGDVMTVAYNGEL